MAASEWRGLVEGLSYRAIVRHRDALRCTLNRVPLHDSDFALPMNQERSKHDGQPALGLTGAQERGRAAHQRWIADGTLITAADYAARRGLAEHEVAALETRGGLFSVAIDGVPWYPAELLRLSPDAATALCQVIRPLDDVSKLVFVMRTHGALGGLTVTEAALRGQWERALTLAKTWNSE